jgi:hypothetical protein
VIQPASIYFSRGVKVVANLNLSFRDKPITDQPYTYNDKNGTDENDDE